MTDKQIIGGRGSAKSYTILNTIEVMLENEKLKQTLAEIKDIVEQGVKIHDDIIVSKQILQKISEVLDEK